MVYDIACYVRIQEAGFFSKIMSYCREEGKDKLIFVTEEDHATPSSVTLEEDDEEELEGLIKENGEINWDCPCLQGMAYGPCGEQFKGAFSCFHYSEADPKGSDCIPQFRDMQECFMKYPEIYGKDDEFDDEDDSINNKIEMEKTGNEGENIGSSEKNDSLTSNSKRDDPGVSADGSDANSTSS